MAEKDDFYIPEEVAEWIGLKKSEYLSKLIENQRPGDLGFEDYHLYDSNIPQTIEKPDKVYESIIDHIKVRIYLRTNQTSFLYHQIVIGAVIPDKASGNEVFVPILSFVTKMAELVSVFCQGEVKNHHTLN